MKKSLKFFGTMLMIVILASTIVTTSCKKKEKVVDPPVVTPQSPTVPPQSTMAMDFSGFQQKANPSDTVIVSNWGKAAFTVGVWNLILTVNLAVPVAAFAESFNHQPTQLSDGTWEWTYSVPVGQKTYTAKLHGKVENSQITWKMYLSQGIYVDILWFTGTSDVAATQGQWILNNAGQAFLQIDWHRNTTNNTADIKYLNIIPNDAENGGFISYGLTTDSQYNAFYTIYNKGQNNTTNITWNRSTKEGKIKDPKGYTNSDWHCWSSALQNVTCP